jgi:predicted ArsR family transcriptional regulator
MELTSITPNAEQLKALTHPVRLRLLAMLRIDGPATATSLSARLGLNTGATSYHLRQLAQHGFIVDDPERGNARDRWWRASHQSTTVDRASLDSAGREAIDAFQQAVAIEHTEWLQRAMEERGRLPEEWRAASTLSDYALRLTPGRAGELLSAISALLWSWAESDPDDEDAADVAVILHAFPRPGTLVTEHHEVDR